MNEFKKMRGIGAVIGMTVLTMLGLVCSVSQNVGQAVSSPSVPPPLNPAVTAPAKALGNAFAAIAAHVRPAVVSV
jgi:hypothetical protein